MGALTNPPHTVNFAGLLENVVPIPKMSQTIEYTMKSDQIRKVECEQCCVLPQLPAEINGHSQNTLIKQFHAWKGLNYVP